MSYKLYDIAGAAGAVNSDLKNGGMVIENLLVDSRRLLFPHNTLFIALNTRRASGNRFVADLYNKGVKAFMVEQNFEGANQYPDADFLVVQNTLDAFQQLVAHHRSRFNIPIIGITGSNGKTVVKEWLYQLLQADYNIVRSPKSYNSQTGVPLSVWEINDTHNIGIFEAGISLPGEMEKLQHIIKPDTGIYTFHGNAHAEGFSGEKEKINEKLALFRNAKKLIYCADEEVLHEQVLEFNQGLQGALQLFAWGKSDNCFVQIVNISYEKESSTIAYLYKGNRFSFSIPFADEASVHNAITCCTVMLQMDYPPAEISRRVLQLHPLEMRLQLLQGINNCSIINDAYSADLESLNIALDFLQQQQQHQKRSLVISDLVQTALEPQKLYAKIAEIIRHKNLYRLVGIGSEIMKWKGLFSFHSNASFFETTDDFLRSLPDLNFKDETVLLKGARVFEFEKISTALEQKMHQTVLEINLTAMRHNLNVYRSIVAPGVKLMAMVKAFGYGSGSWEIANLLQHAGVDYLAVAYADEGVELRKAGIRLPIMVMNIDEPGFENLVKHKLEPELFSFRILESFGRFLNDRNIEQYPVHLKLDTGMHRLGFEPQDMERLSGFLKGRTFQVKSVFSHLVASGEELHDTFTQKQAEVFTKMCGQLEAALDYSFIKHICNTSAIARFPQYQLGMVRLGIGLYGVESMPQIQSLLKTVTTFKTTIAQIRKVRAGESIGYSRKGVVQKDSVIATVRVGYADGYYRDFGNGVGKMMVKGRLAPVIGNVCMDMTMIDITGIDAAEEDEVIVFGEQLPVAELASLANTIPYEILTSVSQRVKRVYFEE